MKNFFLFVFFILIFSFIVNAATPHFDLGEPNEIKNFSARTGDYFMTYGTDYHFPLTYTPKIQFIYGGNLAYFTIDVYSDWSYPNYYWLGTFYTNSKMVENYFNYTGTLNPNTYAIQDALLANSVVGSRYKLINPLDYGTSFDFSSSASIGFADGSVVIASVPGVYYDNLSNSNKYYVNNRCSGLDNQCFVYNLIKSTVDEKTVFTTSELFTFDQYKNSYNVYGGNIGDIVVSEKSQEGAFAYILNSRVSILFKQKLDKLNVYQPLTNNNCIYKIYLRPPPAGINYVSVYGLGLENLSETLWIMSTKQKGLFIIINPSDGHIIATASIPETYDMRSNLMEPKISFADGSLYVFEESKVFKFNLPVSRLQSLTYAVDPNSLSCDYYKEQQWDDSIKPVPSIDGIETDFVSEDVVYLNCSDNVGCKADRWYYFIDSTASCSSTKEPYLLNHKLDTELTINDIDLSGKSICLWVEDSSGNFQYIKSSELKIGSSADISISSPSQSVPAYSKPGGNFQVIYTSTEIDLASTYTIQTTAINVCNPITDSDGPTSFTCNVFATASEGTYALQAKVVNSRNLSKTSLKPDSVKIDSTLPVISNNVPDSTISNLKPVISANYSDPLSNAVSSGIDLTTAKIFVDGVEAVSVTKTVTGISFTPTTPLKSGFGNKGKNTVKVQVSDKAGNIAAKEWSFNINQVPIAGISGSDTGSVNNKIDLTSTSTDADTDALTYSWEITIKPAGSNATLNSASSSATSFIPDKEGTYSIKLTASDGALSNSISKSIQVSDTAPIISNLIATPDSGNNILSVALNASVTDPDTSLAQLKFNWDFGNGKKEEKIGLATITHDFQYDQSNFPNATESTKAFNVVLTVTDPENHSNSSSVQVAVSNNPPEITNLTANGTSILNSKATATYENGKINFQANAIDADSDALTYKWTIDNQEITAQNIEQVFSSVGSVNATLIVSDGFNSVSIPITINVTSRPKQEDIFKINSIEVPDLAPVDSTQSIKASIERIVVAGANIPSSTELIVSILDSKTRIQKKQEKINLDFSIDNIRSVEIPIDLAQLGVKENSSLLLKFEVVSPSENFDQEIFLQNNKTKAYVPVTSPTRSVVPDNNLIFIPLIAFAVLIILKKKKD